MQVSPYLFLYGRCEEAIAFYLEATGGEILQNDVWRYAGAGRTGGRSVGAPPAAGKDYACASAHWSGRANAE